jgi:hypothetical protein
LGVVSHGGGRWRLQRPKGIGAHGVLLSDMSQDFL